LASHIHPSSLYHHNFLEFRTPLPLSAFTTSSQELPGGFWRAGASSLLMTKEHGSGTEPMEMADKGKIERWSYFLPIIVSQSSFEC